MCRRLTLQVARFVAESKTAKAFIPWCLWRSKTTSGEIGFIAQFRRIPSTEEERLSELHQDLHGRWLQEAAADLPVTIGSGAMPHLDRGPRRGRWRVHWPHSEKAANRQLRSDAIRKPLLDRSMTHARIGFRWLSASATWMRMALPIRRNAVRSSALGSVGTAAIGAGGGRNGLPPASDVPGPTLERGPLIGWIVNGVSNDDSRDRCRHQVIAAPAKAATASAPMVHSIQDGKVNSLNIGGQLPAVTLGHNRRLVTPRVSVASGHYLNLNVARTKCDRRSGAADAKCDGLCPHHLLQPVVTKRQLHSTVEGDFSARPSERHPFAARRRDRDRRRRPGRVRRARRKTKSLPHRIARERANPHRAALRIASCRRRFP